MKFTSYDHVLRAVIHVCLVSILRAIIPPLIEHFFPTVYAGPRSEVYFVSGPRVVPCP